MFFLLLLIKLLPSFSVLFSPGCSCSKLHVDSLSHTVFAFKSAHQIHHEHTQAITRSIAAFVIALPPLHALYIQPAALARTWPPNNRLATRALLLPEGASNDHSFAAARRPIPRPSPY